MNRSLPTFISLPVLVMAAVLAFSNPVKAQLSYGIRRVKKPVTIDANWDKKAWKKIPEVKIGNPMGKVPAFSPVTTAKVAYDDHHLYLIFKVEDKFVKSTVTEYNGNVSGDSCVEFFFAPDETQPLHYFNLEINAGGTPLMFFVTKPWTEFTPLDNESISQIQIAHSQPKVVDPEVKAPTTWVIECKIPYEMLKKFSNVTMPRSGAEWHANFYKTGSRTSNPHWFTWSPVDFPKPNFHLPEFFGTLKFK
ncbi:carbohydrate-binding family 9-like protein [Ravibacter arvi]